MEYVFTFSQSFYAVLLVDWIENNENLKTKTIVSFLGSGNFIVQNLANSDSCYKWAKIEIDGTIWSCMILEIRAIHFILSPDEMDTWQKEQMNEEKGMQTQIIKFVCKIGFHLYIYSFTRFHIPNFGFCLYKIAWVWVQASHICVCVWEMNFTSIIRLWKMLEFNNPHSSKLFLQFQRINFIYEQLIKVRVSKSVFRIRTNVLPPIKA